MNLSIPFALALAAILLAPQVIADGLPACEAWLENRQPLNADRLPDIDAQGLESAGVRIEPSRRMRAKDYPWEHHIQIALPPSYDSTERGGNEQRFPVLWVTDGQFFFHTAAGIVASCAHKHVPEMIVVSVGATPEADRAANEIQMRRSFDFSPNTIKGFKGFGSTLQSELQATAHAKNKAQGSFIADRLGGAPRFLPFIVEDVRRQLAQDYRMAGDHTLFGDSGGGLFCTYALLARPAGFDRYICGSPSLSANDFEVFRMEERHARQHKDLAAAVFFGVGEAEVLQGGGISAGGIVSSTARMAELLKVRAYPSMKLSFRAFSGENHLSVIPLNLAWGLREVWKNELSTQPTGAAADRSR